jgi:hypothetical protein
MGGFLDWGNSTTGGTWGSTKLVLTTTTGTVGNGYIQVPVQVEQPPAPRDDSSLGWLREQVKEVCDLAWAA